MPFGRTWDDQFAELFAAHHGRIERMLDRLTGDPEAAADAAQETFIRLYRRGATPDAPEAWLITVALNLTRNLAATGSRRRRLLTASRAQWSQADPPPAPDRAVTDDDPRNPARAALDALAPRERAMLLLRAEGYSYNDIAAALEMAPASVGTTLARARRAFLDRYGPAPAS